MNNLLIILLLYIVLSLEALSFTSLLFERSVPIQNFLSKRAKLISTTGNITDYGDYFCLTKITLGTPAQSFFLSLDTTSSFLWIFDSKCKQSGCINPNTQFNFTRTFFHTEKSSTFQVTSSNFSIANVNGMIGKDIFGISPNLIFPSQGFGLAENVSSIYSQEPFDGIFGLGWPSLATNGVTPPLQNLLPQLDKPLFTVGILKALGFKNFGADGFISFGSTNTQFCDPNIQYTPLTNTTYWQFLLNGFSIGTYTDSKKYQVISSTSSHGIGGPHLSMMSISRQIGAQYSEEYGIYVVDCTKINTMPPLVFTINGIKYNVTADQYISNNQIAPGQCLANLFDTYEGEGSYDWIFGAPWIRSYCNVYDIGNKQIGFAKLLKI